MKPHNILGPLSGLWWFWANYGALGAVIFSGIEFVVPAVAGLGV